MICTPAPAFHPVMTRGLRPWSGMAELRAHLRSALLVAFLVLAASFAALAEEALQDWVPEALALPADAEIETDRSIGSSIRMFSFSTMQDGDALLAEWEVALQEAGYRINQSQDDIIVRAIEFSGHDILNAKILVSEPSTSERWLVEFDATMR